MLPSVAADLDHGWRSIAGRQTVSLSPLLLLLPYVLQPCLVGLNN